VLFVPRNYRLEDLLHRRVRLLERRKEIQSTVSLLEKVVVLWELSESYCSLGTVTVWEPRGNGTSAVGSRNQKTGEDI
jgi:hypothetical protein